MGTDLVGEASREDRAQILRQVGKVTVDTLKKVGFKKLKRLSLDYAKDIIKKMKQDNGWSCKGTMLKKLAGATPKRMRMFLPAKCVEEADATTVDEISEDLGEAAIPEEDEEPRSLRKILLSPAASTFTSRVMKKVKRMTKKQIKPFLNSMMVELVPVRKLKDIPAASVCNDDMSYGYTVPAQRLLLLEKCKSSFGTMSGRNSALYGALASVMTKEDIEAMDAEDDDIWSTAQTFCQQEADLTQEQEKALYNKIKPRLIRDSYAALKDEGTLEKSKCLLKHLDDSILNNIENGDREKVCEYIGKGELIKMQSKTVERLKTLCLKTKISYKKMGGLLRAMKASDLKDEDEQVMESFEELSSEVIAPDAREALYSTACSTKSRDGGGKIGATEMALCGRLVSEFGDLSTVDQEVVVDLVEPISRECEAGRKRMWECVRNGQAKAECRQNHKGCKESLAHIFRTISKSEAVNRKRRSVRAPRATDETCLSTLTCDDIKLAGTEAVLIDPDQLKALCKSHFDDCASTLGSLSDYTAEHRQALLETAIEHWGEPKTWTAEQVERAGVIVLAMARSQLEMIPITNLETAHSVGQHYEWNTQPEKLTTVFDNWLRTSKQNNVSTITSVDLRSIGHIACGAGTDAIDQIHTEVYMDAAQAIGRLDTCSVLQLRGWAQKAVQSLGQVTEWSRADVATVGSVIGGLSKAEIQLLTTAQIQAIPYYTIPNIPAMCFSKFTEDQLRQFHSLQAVHITDDQIKSLSDTKRAIVTVKAEQIRTQATIQDPDPDAGGAFICASLWVLLTGLLAFFLQI
ncbi:uncharacterized protein LOC135461597 [Liolophura sinensis]|uniref:uncharacterized protein LOC135461597 n=1 Tax=Liolophura sinensis TaxID=3198878 RepID=UPI003158043B